MLCTALCSSEAFHGVCAANLASNALLGVVELSLRSRTSEPLRDVETGQWTSHLDIIGKQRGAIDRVTANLGLRTCCLVFFFVPNSSCSMNFLAFSTCGRASDPGNLCRKTARGCLPSTDP